MNADITANKTLPTELEVRDLVTTWYHKLDNHVPVEDLNSMLFEDSLRMVFPEVTVSGLAGVQQWYERAINLFFDETHTVKEIRLTPKDDRVEVKVVVKWEANRWIPPAPRSERIMCDAYQTWEVVRSPVSNKPVIATYIVDSLSYDDGSARL